ncbi:Lrp/AsnC family transcriptional regulator, partial [Hyphomonas sp.]|uniref:Lrp/AsnC family transcriptional regulator n=1 Tax=Hyphomonas sp. TaxID=87 RepID=UPI000C96E4E5
LCNLDGQWTKYNMLMDQKDFKILELYKEGKSAQEIHKLHKDIGSLALIYRRIDKMKKEGIIPNEKQTIDL